MKTFASSFLIQQKNVTTKLISSSFKLKASLLGGTGNVITHKELDQFSALLEVLKNETTRLLPYVYDYVNKPTAESVIVFAQEVEKSGSVLDKELSISNAPAFTLDAAKEFLGELESLHGLSVPWEWVETIFAAKRLLIGGSNEEIKSNEWGRIFKTGFTVGGTVMAVVKLNPEKLYAPNQYMETILTLSEKIHNQIDTIIDYHGGRLDLSVIDEVIDAVPENQLPISKSVIKQVLRPLVNKMMWSPSEEYLTYAAIDLVFYKIKEWVRGVTHIRSIYQNYELSESGVAAEKLVESAEDYLVLLDDEDRTRVNRIIRLVRHYKPFFSGVDNQVTYAYLLRHSLHNVEMLHWVEMAAEHLLASYSSVSTRDKGTLDDLYNLIHDYIVIAEDLNLVHDVANIHEKRFGEADLFTYASNGNNFLELEEAVYTIPILISTLVLSSRIQNTIELDCSTDGLDDVGRKWMDITCFRERFKGEHRSFWDHLPLLVDYYGRLDATGKSSLHKSIEEGARRYGYSDLPIGSYDVESMAGVLHYVESIFNRYDVDSNTFLDLDEVMGAYPTFKRIITDVGGLDPDDDLMIEAVFTYLVRFGQVPSEDFLGMAHFIAWFLWRPFWTIKADRSAIYKIISIVVAQADPPDFLINNMSWRNSLTNEDIENYLDMAEYWFKQ